ncbi:MAG TPA: rhamnulokinase family protein [Pyrinomonadaceae bacterium]|jgi:rhamnulokinase|nr:rhamnulokinase family protein [Pyrinomonadaceae bacterium]
MRENLYIAVDLGAGSGRVFLCDLAENFSLEEIHRFAYPPREENGHLRWDFTKIFSEIKFGLKKAGTRAKVLNKKIYSLGVDSWAVDYGLIDKTGKLIANPVCYRDSRTEGAMEKIFAKVSREAIFEKTGIQFLNFNTLYQLFAEDGNLEKAGKLLLLPDLINYFLTGKVFAEYTNATTTQFLNAETKNWDFEILEKLNIPASLLPEIAPAGSDSGFLKTELAEELDLENVRVVTPATHDTASAVIGAPLEKNWAYISSGTWSLVGVEIDKPLINEQVAGFNFTNEGGAFGTIRFLKNVMGLWIFESCRKEWNALEAIDVGYENLLRETAAIKGFQGFIFPDDERFLNPPGMLKAIAEQMRESGQVFDGNPAAVCKIIFDSLAFRYASVLRTIEKLTAQKLAGVQIVGGGGRNEYLNQMTANASGLRVQAGLTEATVTGNALVQAISAGRFANLKDARSFVKNNVSLREFTPQKSSEIESAARVYAEIEARFIK